MNENQENPIKNCTLQDSEKLLLVWQQYSESPYSQHPCENFKAGWTAHKLMMDGGEVDGTQIRQACYELKF